LHAIATAGARPDALRPVFIAGADHDLYEVELRWKCKGMDMPDKNRFGTSEPDGPPAAGAAKEFFPDIATARAGLQAAQIGIWSWDIAAGALAWSSSLESMHGMAAGSFDGTYACFSENIHPGDRADVKASLNEALRTRSIYRARYRTLPREGRDECWLESAGMVVTEIGIPERMVGMCHDV